MERDEIFKQLDDLGVDYKRNASTESLIKLLESKKSANLESKPLNTLSEALNVPKKATIEDVIKILDERLPSADKMESLKASNKDQIISSLSYIESELKDEDNNLKQAKIKIKTAINLLKQ